MGYLAQSLKTDSDRYSHILSNLRGWLMQKKPYDDLFLSMNASVPSKCQVGLADEMYCRALDLMDQERDQEPALYLRQENTNSGFTETIPM